MAKIQSVLGVIDSSDLGPTLVHEHILIANHAMRKAFPNWVVREEFVPYAVEKLNRAKRSGIKTILDLTPINLGRDIDVIHEVADKAEMQVIASTGFYHFEEWWIRDKNVDWLAELLINEIENGISGTNIRAGLIKCATDMEGMTPANRHMLTAVARAHKATGVPISTHATVWNYIGFEQQEVFLSEGVDISKIVIGHCGDSTNVEFIEALIKRGSYVGMDRFGIDWMLPLKERVDTVVELCKHGYANKMVLSCDHTAFLDYKEDQRNVTKNPWDEYKAKNLDDVEVQFSYLMEKVVPELKKNGISVSQINQMLIDNPRRIFEGKP